MSRFLLIFLITVFFNPHYALARLYKTQPVFKTIRCSERGAKINVAVPSFTFSMLKSYARLNGWRVYAAPEIQSIETSSLTVPVGFYDLCSLAGMFAYSNDAVMIMNKSLISFTKYIKRDFVLPFPQGSISSSVSMGGSGASDTGLAEGQMSLAYQTSVDIWEKVKSNLNAMLGQQTSTVSDNNTAATSFSNGRYFLDEATGKLVIEATPETMKKVSDFIDKLKRLYSTTIKVRLTIMSVDERGNLYTSNRWRAALRTILTDAPWRMGLRTPVFEGWVSSSQGFLGNPSIAGAPEFGFSTIEGSQESYVFSALKEFVDVNIIDQATIMLTNGNVAGVSRGISREYVASISETVGQTTTSTSFEKGKILSGIRIYCSGHLTEDGKITLSVFSNLSDLKAMEEVKTAEYSIQNPTIEQKTNFAAFVVPDGQPVLLFSQMSRKTGVEKRGLPGIEKLPIVGRLFGAQSNYDQTESLIIMLVPEIVKNGGGFVF